MLKLFIPIIIATGLGLGVAHIGGQGGISHVSGLSVFFLCGCLAYFINWLAYIPAVIKQTEKYYDLMGSVTFLSVIALALYLSAPHDLRAILVAAMVCIWALRLGSFLFGRIRRDGHDKRFKQIKTAPLRFFLTWTLQASWVVLTSACALMIITSNISKPMGLIGIGGALIWLIGFAIEVVADGQKNTFRKQAENKDRFIASGLWAWSRHPNYFGEIMLWTGIAIMAVPILSGWQWIVLISPIFVTFLLTKVSGIPMLERIADKKWADDPEYQSYKSRTPALIMKPPKS